MIFKWKHESAVLLETGCTCDLHLFHVSLMREGWGKEKLAVDG